MRKPSLGFGADGGRVARLQSSASNGQEVLGSATSVKPQADANSRTLRSLGPPFTPLRISDSHLGRWRGGSAISRQHVISV